MDEVAAGRSKVLDLSEAASPLPALPDRIRSLTELQILTLDPRIEIEALPSWLSELRHLEVVDARYTGLRRVPELPNTRWTVTAGTLLDCVDQLNPRQVDGVSVARGTSAGAIAYLIELAERGDLDLTELLSTVLTRTPREARSKAASSWADLGVLDSFLDKLIERQPGLRAIDLSGLSIDKVPESIRKLRRLEELDLSRTNLTTVPDWLLNVPAVATLRLERNKLTDLPMPIGEPRWLRSLSLDGNPLTQIPKAIWRLINLEHLSLNGCPISDIPGEVLHLRSLRTLSFDDYYSHTTTPPPEVVNKGLYSIKAYWRQQQEAGVDHLAEAKLLIVGEAGAGKTTLARKIIAPSYELRPAEPSTEGIDVLSWEFLGAIRVRGSDDVDRVLERDILVNIWDFGGQEIYHATHQFFLTKRSVYVLVTDERKEDTDFEYWLEIIDLLSDGSPVLIVQNRKQGRSQGIDVGAIRQRYRNMRDALVLDLADNSGLDTAVDRIRRELEQLPHIGTPLPTTWREVRLALEADPRDHITADEYFRICADKGFTRDDDMRQLGDYLHDLGICLFFQDDPLLRKTVVLKPEWGTTAVYRVLDDPSIADALGVFTDSDLARIWRDSTYAPMRHELLRLMERFGLCYRVPGSATWIAPQLLSPTQPVYGWPDDGNVMLRYEYDVMPKGIVRRLIVDLHNRLVPGDHVWRSGGVFAYGTTRAEVVEDYRRRQLRIRLHGADPRVLLGIIDQALAVIHGSYPRIRVRTFIPCTCDKCTAHREPEMFARDKLEDFVRTGDLIQCGASRKMVDPLVVLGVLSSEADRRATVLPDDVDPLPRPTPEVFVSYKWGGPGEALVDELEERLTTRGVPLVRDKSAMRYRDSIRDFMSRLGAGKYIVVVIDNGYLRSDNCMFELTEIAKDPAFRSRIFPVILSDAAIFKARQRLGYIKYWETEIGELDTELTSVGPENLQGIREERDLYETIRNTIAGIVDVLADMNALTPDIHRDTDFAQLHQALDVALSS